MIKKEPNVIPINWIDKTEHHALIPGYINKQKKIKLKEFKNTKGNCYFTSGISHNLIDFIYRSVIRLQLKDITLIFSRGSVKIKNKPVLNAVGIRKLDWNVGISLRIPHKLNYNKKINININNEEQELRLMEVIVLSALLHIACPEKSSRWCTNKAVLIIACGWNQFRNQ